MKSLCICPFSLLLDCWIQMVCEFKSLLLGTKSKQPYSSLEGTTLSWFALFSGFRKHFKKSTWKSSVIILIKVKNNCQASPSASISHDLVSNHSNPSKNGNELGKQIPGNLPGSHPALNATMLGFWAPPRILHHELQQTCFK